MTDGKRIGCSVVAGCRLDKVSSNFLESILVMPSLKRSFATLTAICLTFTIHAQTRSDQDEVLDRDKLPGLVKGLAEVIFSSSSDEVWGHVDAVKRFRGLAVIEICSFAARLDDDKKMPAEIKDCRIYNLSLCLKKLVEPNPSMLYSIIDSESENLKVLAMLTTLGFNQTDWKLFEKLRNDRSTHVREMAVSFLKLRK